MGLQVWSFCNKVIVLETFSDSDDAGWELFTVCGVLEAERWRTLELRQVEDEEWKRERADSNARLTLDLSGEGGQIGNLVSGERDPPWLWIY